jgi:hypothetical protein
MNAYRVHYAYYADEPESAATIVGTTMHVAARTREEAVYKCFDELADQDVEVESFSAVYMQDGDRWLIVHPHKQMAGV